MNRARLTMVVALALAAGVVSTATATDWVLDRDFSKTTNPNGQWSYGVYLEDWFNSNGYPDGWLTWPAYYDWPGTDGQIGSWSNPNGDLGAGAVFYTNSDTPFGANQWWAPHKVMLHPGAAGWAYAPVVRWTAPSDMKISVNALFYGCEETTTDVHVLLNGDMFDGPGYWGIHLFDGNIVGNYGYAPLNIPATNPDTNHAAYIAEIDVLAGDKIDFACGYGGNGYASDLTGLDVTITKIEDLPPAKDWVLDRDFSKTANPSKHWEYGVYLPDGRTYMWRSYYDWPGDGTIGVWGNPPGVGGDLSAGAVFYTNSDQPLGGIPPGNQWWAPRKVMLHPAAVGWAYAPLIRWTAPYEITVAVDVLFYGCEETTTDVHVLLNGGLIPGPEGAAPTYSGTHLLDGFIEGNYGYAPLNVPASGTSNNLRYAGVLHLAAGDRLDFVVGYGSNNLNNSDLTGLDITIAKACNNIWADMDGDNDVDQADFAQFQACFTGPIGTIGGVCRCVDRAGATGPDGIIDGMDFAAFLTCWTGPAVPSTGCP